MSERRASVGEKNCWRKATDRTAENHIFAADWSASMVKTFSQELAVLYSAKLALYFISYVLLCKCIYIEFNFSR